MKSLDRKNQEECDCKMFIGGKGKPCYDCEKSQDKNIAQMAINSLSGQSQYDFLIDYFDEIRKHTKHETINSCIAIIDNWTIKYRFNYDCYKKMIDELKQALYDQL